LRTSASHWQATVNAVTTCCRIATPGLDDVHNRSPFLTKRFAGDQDYAFPQLRTRGRLSPRALEADADGHAAHAAVSRGMRRRRQRIRRRLLTRTVGDRLVDRYRWILRERRSVRRGDQHGAEGTRRLDLTVGNDAGCLACGGSS
jgi:hypothetical protein